MRPVEALADSVRTAVVDRDAGGVSPAQPPRAHGGVAAFGLAFILVVYAGATILAMRQTSTTFDEILLPAAGARGYATGDFDLIKLYHPRLMQYLYGLPVVLSLPTYPDELGQWTGRAGFAYSRTLFFGLGNDGPALAFRARLVAVAFGMALIAAVFLFLRRRYGPVPAVLGAGMTAFLPDVLAHGGISYNDVPIALAYFLSVWAIDRAARSTTAADAVAAAVAVGLALGVKYSAIALAPTAAVLMAAEAAARGRDWRAYAIRILRVLPLAAAVVYLVLVALYLGDFTLASFRDGLAFNIEHASDGHGGVPAWLMGRAGTSGFWYFFPAAFLIKTPAALHGLLALAVLGALAAPRGRAAVLASPARGMLLAGLIFTLFLLRSNLNIGFRHALPVLPFVIVLAAVGLGRLWQTGGRLARAAIGGALVVQAASVLSWYPHFIPYTSEYFGDRDGGYRLLVDSSLDWGQGLPLLREFLQEHGESTVYLSYFGSALPEAYGIDYVPLPSFFPLAPRTPPDTVAAPRFLAVSATNLVGNYIGDVFAYLHGAEPYRVLGHHLFVYRVAD
jgi:hypothetical protein